MRILVLNGSPRPKGNTKQMVAAFRVGAESAGHQVDVCRKKIAGCLACEMGKIFSFIIVFLLAFPMTACGQNKAEENETAGGIETIPAIDTTESVRETGIASGDTGSEPAAEGIRESCLAIP